MRIFKLTNARDQTYNNFQWTPGKTEVITTHISRRLCSSSYFHVYEDPLLAVLMDPSQGGWIRNGSSEQGNYALIENNPNPPLTTAHLWVGWGSDQDSKTDGTLKWGVRQCRLDRRLSMPIISHQHRYEIAIRSALAALTNYYYYFHRPNLSFMDVSNDTCEILLEEIHTWLKQPVPRLPTSFCPHSYNAYLKSCLSYLPVLVAKQSQEVQSRTADLLINCSQCWGVSAATIIDIAYGVTGKSRKLDYYRKH